MAEEEEKFRALFNASHQLVILLDGNGMILDINETGRNLLDDKAEKYIGTKLADCDFWLTVGDSVTIRNAIENAQSKKMQRELVNIAGQFKKEIILDVIIKNVPLSGRVGNFVVVEGRDISDRVRASKSLMESENRLSRAQRIAHIGNWEWDIPKNELKWSDEVYNIFKVPKKDFNGTYDGFLEMVHLEDREAIEKAVRKSLNSDEPYSLTHKIVCPDGTEKIVHEIGEIIRIEDGAPLRMEGTVQDVTDRWMKQQELIEAKNNAERANLAKMQFLATMSHELRTPLNAIIGFGSLIESQTFSECAEDQNVEYATYIHESGQHLLSLINDILDVSRLELEAIKPEPSSFSFPVLIKESINIMIGKSQEKDIYIDVQVPPGMKNVYLDKKLCKQIIINLLSNAIKFSFVGETVSIKLEEEENSIKLSITDNGIGLEEDDLNYVFEPFNQVNRSYLSGNEGVGLGLTIVKKLTELQQGKITVSSEQQVETCFEVVLPTILSQEK